MSFAEPNLRDLKVRAQQLNPSVKLGKAGATPEFLAELNGALDRHQLVKIRFEGFKDERKALSKELAEKSNSLLVLQVGHTAVFYRKPTAPQSEEEAEE
jgi:RNA-binding protein